MKIIETNTPKIRFGEGNVFATDEYDADCIAVVINQRVDGPRRPPLFLPSDFEEYKRSHKGVFTIVYGLDKTKQPILTLTQVKPCIMEMLDHAKRMGCKRIGVFGSQVSDGTFVEGARETYEAVKEWVSKNGDFVEHITLIDKSGDYNQFLCSEN